jgi:hypothetical protein
MTDDDRDLERVFESTAAAPSAFELTRMKARARELPARLERVPRRLPRWSWAPAFAAAAALGALGITLTQALSPEAPSPSAGAFRTAKIAPAATAAEHPSARTPASSATQPTTERRAPEDEAELDALSLPVADDDPFDLSSQEEMELSR